MSVTTETHHAKVDHFLYSSRNILPIFIARKIAGCNDAKYARENIFCSKDSMYIVIPFKWYKGVVSNNIFSLPILCMQ